MDGITYDFQAAGEYVLLRSTEGDLQIQTRQVPVGAAGYISSTRPLR